MEHIFVYIIYLFLLPMNSYISLFTFVVVSNFYFHFFLHPEGSLGRNQKEGLALDLGCAALAIKGQKVDVKLPLLKQG